MKERPILLCGPMVQKTIALLKTQTRRVVKLPKQAKWGTEYEGCIIFDNGSPFGHEMSVDEMVCPYGQIGDLFLVKETWSTHACFNDISPKNLTTRSIHYWADGFVKSGKKRQSIFMPRWASRILLEITSVRVERLHEISEEDALLAEGITKTDLGFSYCENSYYTSAKEAYESLWKSLNGVQSWLDNPWVWVITFKVVEIKQ